MPWARINNSCTEMEQIYWAKYYLASQQTLRIKDHHEP